MLKRIRHIEINDMEHWYFMGIGDADIKIGRSISLIREMDVAYCIIMGTR